ncbi:MAG: ferrochelatase [Gammaproteobacteria bacterium]|nr:ferrochelatase [Gammaproteobacteria bacterium]
MKYTSQQDFKHDRQPRTGILLVNLGTPNAPTAAAVRRYLGEFLSDPRVVEIPRLIWWLILNGIVLRFRPKRVAHAYASIWMDGGSPLLVYSRAIADALRARCEAELGGPVLVELAMRYGSPAMRDVLRKMREQQVERLFVLPLYPQYSATTSATVFDALAAELKHWRWLPELRMSMHYHDHPQYIKALAASIRDGFTRHGRPDKLVFSFHGLPERCLHSGDPYYCHCQKTARLVAADLQLEADDWLVSFQSRFGRERWLQPYTNVTLQELARAGTRHVQIVSPGFAADCLETLEELAMQNKEVFLLAGGEKFHYIPALNADPTHIDALYEIVRTQTQGWSIAELDTDQRRATSQRAHEHGAEK